MKFNVIKKEVYIYDRILCFLLAAAITSAFILCSFSCPITAHAIGEADNIASDIRNFYVDTKRELDRVERAIATDINNGNLDASSALYTEYMTTLALQYAMVSSPNFSTLVSLANSYNDGTAEAQKFLDYLNNNPTTTFSGSGSSGIYRSALDNKIHSVTLLPGLAPGEYRNFTATCAVSDEFEYTVTYTQNSEWNRNIIVTDSYVQNGYSRVLWDNVWMWGDVSVVANNYFYGYNGTIDNNVQGFTACTISSGNLPDGVTLDRARTYNPLTTPAAMGYNRVDTTLPTASVDTTEPWNYYNDTLLPYMQETYPEVTNNYYIYPNGYTPAPSPTDPPEPTAPFGDLVLPPYGELVTEPSSYYVTDESGETITDESGEPVTETTMVPVTAVTVENGNYFFRVPTLPTLYMTDTGELNISLPIKYASICGGLFSACYDVLDSSGILGVLPFLVGMAVIIYVVYKVGG